MKLNEREKIRIRDHLFSPETAYPAAEPTRSSGAHHVRCVSRKSGSIVAVVSRKPSLDTLIQGSSRLKKRGSKNAAKGLKSMRGGWLSRLIYSRPGRVGASFDLGTSLRSCPTSLHISFCVTPALPITALFWANASSYFPIFCLVTFPWYNMGICHFSHGSLKSIFQWVVDGTQARTHGNKPLPRPPPSPASTLPSVVSQSRVQPYARSCLM